MRLPTVSASDLLSISFSPVAGIQWVETIPPLNKTRIIIGFSPVAGIQWVETIGIGKH